MEQFNKIRVEHRQEIEKRGSKLRLSKASFMNNSKWEKLFKAVANSEISLCGESIKFIDAEKCYEHFSLKYDGLYSWVRYSTRDGSGGGPSYYKDIEWIFVPAVYEIERWNREERLQPKRITNDISALKKLIDELGVYEYDFNEEGLKIYGYK